MVNSVSAKAAGPVTRSRKRTAETTAQATTRTVASKSMKSEDVKTSLSKGNWKLLPVSEGKAAASGKVDSFASKYQVFNLTRCFDPDSEDPYRVSRSGIEECVKCPRCFYLHRRDGIGPPPGYPFSLNVAVDELLKKEFDIYREKGIPHPKVAEAGIDAIPFQHEKMKEWRNNFKGVSCFHEPTNMTVFGAIDDVWINKKGELIVVDYKATSKKDAVTLDAAWQDSYKRQMEVYQWLFRQNGFKVSDVSYFVYCNGIKERERFDDQLDFDVRLIPYKGDDSWIEPKLEEIRDILNDREHPESEADCSMCKYVQARFEVEMDEWLLEMGYSITLDEQVS